MSQNRKKKAEIESMFKKIKEGFEEFDSIWDRVYSTEAQAQKEKYEGDLKRQIKKLQRLRDTLKAWMQSPDSVINQHSDQIEMYRKAIEEKMGQFKQCEKETKTKAFSKEGLRQQSRQNPRDEKREEVINRVNNQISKLHIAIENCEVELQKERSKKRNTNTKLIDKLNVFIKTHHWHISNLEIILRQLNNEILDPYELDTTLDDVDDYISNYRDFDYIFDNSIYEGLDLSVSNTYQDADEDDNEESEPETPTPNSPAPPQVVLPRSPVQRTVSQNETPVIPNKPSAPFIKPIPTSPPLSFAKIMANSPPPNPKKPVINYAQVVQRAKSNQEAQKPAAPTPEPKKTPAVSLISEPSFIPPAVPTVESLWNRSELVGILSSAFDDFSSHSHIDTSLIYSPANPLTVPTCFPQAPKEALLDGEVIGNMDESTLLFAYSYALSDAQRVRIGRALVEKKWSFDKQNRTWVKETSEDYKRYDYSTWSLQSVSKASINVSSLEQPLFWRVC